VADMLEQGAAWLDGMRTKHASRTVTYIRGTDAVELSATLGQTTYEIADEYGVPTPLTDRAWVVIDLMRSEYFDKGTGPTVRKISKLSDVTTKELFALFPKGPAKLAAMVAGIPKPKGCI